jgi:prophage regulatory protein
MQSNTSQHTFAQQQHIPQILIRREEVERLTALSRSRIYDLMKHDSFPKPVRLGAMSVAWIQEEVLEWIAARIADRNAAEAKALN